MTSETKEKYRTVVIDFPWNLEACGFFKKGFYHGKNGERILPYNVMTDEEIEHFAINDFADENCDLFLWATQKKLPAAIRILENWGFKYHVTIAWNKMSGICVSGFYRNVEFVVYGYRGKRGVNIREGQYIPTLIKEKSKGHSQKPDVLYAWLRKRTEKPRIDIFARKRHYGFDSWGNQVDSQIQMPLMEAKI